MNKKSRAEVCTAYTHFERFVSRFIVSPPTAIYPLTIAKIAIFFDILSCFVGFFCSIYNVHLFCFSVCLVCL